MEWAPKVRVNAVSAGLVATDDSLDHYGGPEGLGRVAATVPSGRFATPGDVADAVVFLASPLAGYASGANLVLHGGGRVAGLPPRRRGLRRLSPPSADVTVRSLLPRQR